MEFTEAATRRRMVRSFSGAPVPPEVLDRVLAAAATAPSAGNARGWAGVVLVGAEETAPFWAATTTEEWRARSRRWPGLHRAPVVVALFVHPAAYLARYGEPDKARSGLDREAAWPVPYWMVDGGFAALLLQLAALDAGLGACFLGNFRGEPALRRALGVPSDHRYLGAVLLGAPGGDDPPSPSLRRGRPGADALFRRRRW
ncbi:MAG TPA: nitroreductase family protein [Acidimicrobiales bacterium]|nr:nitroreductase family protein [Acidimicrobiales bacterium]